MKNRNVGLLIIGVALLIGFIIFSFNKALSEIVNTSCSHGPTCPMWGSLNFQTNVSLGLMGFVIAIGLYLIFFAGKEPIHEKKTKKRLSKLSKDDYKDILKQLNEIERSVFENVLIEDGTIFQSELVKKTGFSKVKVSRILDKLEGRGLLERKRRGMTNVVVLKH